MTWIMSECFKSPVAVAPFSSMSISSTSSQPVDIEGGPVRQEFATVKARRRGSSRGGDFGSRYGESPNWAWAGVP